MALLWTDGMDRYGAAADFSSNTGYYAGNPTTFLPTGGKTGGGALRNSGFNSFRKVFATAGTLTAGGTVHFCGWFKVSTSLGGAGRILGFGTDQWGSNGGLAPLVQLNTNGSLTVFPHNDGTALATSAAGVITANVYQHIEYAAKYNTGANGGFIKMWVNGNSVINFSGNTNVGTVPLAYNDINLGKSIK